MSSASTLFHEAREYAAQGLYMTSYLTFLQAAEESRKSNHLDDVLRCKTNAYISAGKAGVPYEKTLGLLLDIREQIIQRPETVPHDDEFSLLDWVESTRFHRALNAHPARQELLKILNELDGINSADKWTCWHHYYAARGENSFAIEAAEKAWSLCQQGNRSSSHKPVFLLNGMYGEIESDIVKAKHWLAGAQRELKNEPCANCELKFLRAKGSLALAEGRSTPELNACRRAIEDQMARLERSASPENMVIRLYLMDPRNGDPYCATHPAYRALTTKLAEDERDIGTKYSRALLVLDFRLAAIRFALRIQPLDDYYHKADLNSIGEACLTRDVVDQTNPENSDPMVVSISAIRGRFMKCHAAARVALRLSKNLDDLLECSWRQGVIRERLERIDELSKLCD